MAGGWRRSPQVAPAGGPGSTTPACDAAPRVLRSLSALSVFANAKTRRVSAWITRLHAAGPLEKCPVVPLRSSYGPENGQHWGQHAGLTPRKPALALGTPARDPGFRARGFRSLPSAMATVPRDILLKRTTPSSPVMPTSASAAWPPDIQPPLPPLTCVGPRTSLPNTPSPPPCRPLSRWPE